MQLAFDYDLFVIGAGSGGTRAARMSAALGARVAIAEERYLGGTCVNVGCIPKKLFVYGSHYAEDFEDGAAYGWTTSGESFQWPTLRDNKTREIERLNNVYQGLLEGPGAEIIRERAILSDTHTVSVGGEMVTAENILIATGSRPSVPPFPGDDLVITSDDAFYLETFPERVVIIGGGYIAVEFAGIFNGLGAATTLLYRGPLFLRGFDGGIREFVAQEMRAKGIGLRFDTQVASVESVAGGLAVRTRAGDVLEADVVLCATGRGPNTAGLNLDGAGVEPGPSGEMRVDSRYRTSTPNIRAIGDVIGRVQLTPVAIAEGMCIAYNLFGGEDRQVEYDDIPTAIFCQPNIGTVGPTEERARERFPALKVFESAFRPLKHTLTGRDERTMMKLLVDGDSDRVVAAHMVGPEAGEIIQGLGVAIKAGATKADFDRTIGIHPTAAEEFVTMREARA
ncbi:MAG: glutathione-disulfide reductase [Gammaproteobacteria bacterium]|nr:glutathione-disulfide reductase [Gammaproteobacteria bacterium]MDE0226531.1 glutathione-disulfide reductase [Gammaproteobacteria bacterium]